MAIRIELCKTNNWIKENGFDGSQEEEIYEAQLLDIYCNPGWYLDQLEYMIAY